MSVWEIIGYFRQDHLPVRRPLGPALKGQNKTHALHGIIGVPHGGVVDPSLTVIDGHHHRFMPPCPPCLLVRECRCQNMHLFGRAPQAVVKLIPGMKPLHGKSTCDGVVRIPCLNQILVLVAVRSTAAFGGVAHQLILCIVVDIRAKGLVTTTPASQPDHLVVGRPLSKGIVCRMDNNQTASLFQVRLQRELCGIRPRSSAPAKVGNDHIVLSEGWNKIRIGLRFLECLSRSFQGDRPLRDHL